MPRPESATRVDFRSPNLEDGQHLWRMARDSRVLDVNTSYAYLLWARDFAATSIVATVDDDPGGFVIGYRRPDEPETLMIWQVAVDERHRGQGLARRMLDELVDSLSGDPAVRRLSGDPAVRRLSGDPAVRRLSGDPAVRRLETTITADNSASIALFTSFANARSAPIERTPLFEAAMFPDGHDPELLFRIGPFSTARSTTPGGVMSMTTTTEPATAIFDSLESQVRSYCRSWPAVMTHSQGSTLTSEDGREFLDFFAGAGALNYGHNNPALLDPLLDYLREGRILHSLDMHTSAKRDFLQAFSDLILEPRGLDYKVMFPGPTGTNSVEAALKLARKVTGRQHVLSFTNAFHGMTLGSLAVTGNSMKRKGAGIPLTNSSKIPYDDYFNGAVDDFMWLERVLEDSGSGVDKPAAIIVESVQGEGGLNAARLEWLKALSDLCRAHDIILIVDDVQAGCGRTGTFFSFEEAGFSPDIVCLSKSISGFGLPMALTLIRPELDQFEPGEHNGTFRGHNLAFVTAKVALETYWADDSFQNEVQAKAAELRTGLTEIAERYEGATVRGRGLLTGIAFPDASSAGKIATAAYECGLLVETSGPEDEVLKTMPPLTISSEELARGIAILEEATAAVLGDSAA
ncbi:diaminobutyrate--2-oxoglutarate transaminase [Nocardioides sp. YR527]|uniref:diaminobutyrate--2-oxoglutarate transaminase n=1 Tax=Nocardioides sp. YR527 TaxID=1881028 RepID=UPI00210CF45A|nr:diaminobutyrate--2-oxoglutarate transaminase [Nocardioides sp. YR527]